MLYTFSQLYEASNIAENSSNNAGNMSRWLHLPNFLLSLAHAVDLELVVARCLPGSRRELRDRLDRIKEEARVSPPGEESVLVQKRTKVRLDEAEQRAERRGADGRPVVPMQSPAQ